jgi:hypothetical protein
VSVTPRHDAQSVGGFTPQHGPTLPEGSRLAGVLCVAFFAAPLLLVAVHYARRQDLGVGAVRLGTAIVVALVGAVLDLLVLAIADLGTRLVSSKGAFMTADGRFGRIDLLGAGTLVREIDRAGEAVDAALVGAVFLEAFEPFLVVAKQSRGDRHRVLLLLRECTQLRESRDTVGLRLGLCVVGGAPSLLHLSFTRSARFLMRLLLGFLARVVLVHPRLPLGAPLLFLDLTLAGLAFPSVGSQQAARLSVVGLGVGALHPADRVRFAPLEPGGCFLRQGLASRFGRTAFRQLLPEPVVLHVKGGAAWGG